ncbi:MAG: T9SS type A sorting domain-containing protein [Flavobacteriales bacterium]
MNKRIQLWLSIAFCTLLAACVWQKKNAVHTNPTDDPATVEIKNTLNEATELTEVVITTKGKADAKPAEKDAEGTDSVKPAEDEHIAERRKAAESLDKVDGEKTPAPPTIEMIKAVPVTDGATWLCSPTLAVPLGSPTTITFDAAGAYHTITEDMSIDDTYYEEEAETPADAYDGSATMPDATLTGKLTAGEVNDFKKWKMWEDIAEGELDKYRGAWNMNPRERYSVQVLTESGAPVVDCAVELISKSNETIWKARTDNTGKAELWGTVASDKAAADVSKITVKNGTKTFDIKRPKTFERGVNSLKIPVSCSIPDVVDICFTVDATGSMGDEIAYLQAELVDVITKIKTKHKDIALNLGSVFYRDHGDTYVTQNTPFTASVETVNNYIAMQYADGGGDGPEAVDDALQASLNDMKWQGEARARILFMILDAPPHNEPHNLQKMMQCATDAAAKGVRIVPLVASGGGYDVDKSLEYLMRCMALCTNGTYAFLTNHSGIGGNHTEPSTDSYDVETLNNLLLRVIDEYLMVPDCNLQQFIATQEPQDTVSVTTLVEPALIDSLLASADTTLINIQVDPEEIVVLTCFPNPATDYLWVQTNEVVKEMFLADNSGKLMQKLTPTTTLFQLDLTNYPSGIYYVRAFIHEKWVSARIVVARLH